MVLKKRRGRIQEIHCYIKQAMPAPVRSPIEVLSYMVFKKRRGRIWEIHCHIKQAVSAPVRPPI